MYAKLLIFRLVEDNMYADIASVGSLARTFQSEGSFIDFPIEERWIFSVNEEFSGINRLNSQFRLKIY